jgi:hypothetical protein
MKGQTLRYIIATLSLLVFLVSGVQAQQAPKNDQILRLQNAVAELPIQFIETTSTLNLDGWTCGAESLAVTRNVISQYVTEIGGLRYMADTIRHQGEPTLPEAADAAYTF